MVKIIESKRTNLKMTQCKLSAQDFIKNAFTPQIAVLCSPLVNDLCRKNNLSFVELVQPFCQLNAEAFLQDPNGGVVTIHNLKITLIDVNFRPPQPVLARKLLNASVGQTLEPRFQRLLINGSTLDIPASTPWFEAWKETFLQVQFPSSHEFTKHFLACILVISSSDSNPIDTMTHLNQTLNQIQNVVPNKLPKWFSSYILRYYVIVHDNFDEDSGKATQLLETLKVSYGISNCFLLRMNSRPPGQMDEQLPDPWSQYISNNFEQDVGQVTPESSPDMSQSLTGSLDMNREIIDNNGHNLPYHPLRTEIDNQSTEFLSEREPQIIPSSNLVHGMCLTTEDVEQIKLLIHEFCTRALLPHVERQIQNLTEIVSNKKGVSKSLFSATKRWFTPNKIGGNNNGNNISVYAPDAPEIQMRKLGDLYFMFGHYSMAFQVYHAAKRDFNSDQAWFYYAGALEMAGLAAFMANECTRKTYDYVEESIVTYLNVCKMAQFATRATLLSIECLKYHNLHGEAALQLIRMTSEESDLRSALLLEQAAYCFLTPHGPQMIRKYAFHMVLAGHRFSKANQKKHALRCYKQALQVYQDKGWTIAEDHIHYTIGKLSSTLNILQEAADSFSKLMTIQTKQSVEQQSLFLKEYLTSYQTLIASQNVQNIPILLLPLLESESTKILVGPTPPLTIPGKVRALGVSLSTNEDTVMSQKWNKLEEIVVQEVQGSLPLIFKPIVTLYTKHNLSNINIMAIVNEPIQVYIKLRNPLSLSLSLKNIYLSWTLKTSNGDIITNETSDKNTDSFLKTSVTKTLFIANASSQEFMLYVTPLLVGELLLTGIFFTIVEGEGDKITVTGRQLFNLNKLKIVRKESQIIESGLQISILPPAPCLQVTFSEINLEMLCNQIQPITIEMRNVGNGGLHNIYLVTTTPHFISTCEFYKNKVSKVNLDLDTQVAREKESRKNHVAHIPLPSGSLDPDGTHSVNIWLKAPEVKGPVTVDLLIYYENCNSSCVPRYRVIRHEWKLIIHESLQVDVTVSEGCQSAELKQLLFAIKATNMNKLYYNILTEISLLKIGLLSSFWKLVPLENLKINSIITVASQQSGYMLLRGQRNITKNNTYYEVSLTDKQSDVKTKPAYLDFIEKIENAPLNIFEENFGANVVRGNEGKLFFQWRAFVIDNAGVKHTVYGQNYVPIKKFISNIERTGEQAQSLSVIYDSTNSIETKKVENELSLGQYRNQISMCIVYISQVYHNFDEKKLCIVPVKISLHNNSNVSSLITVNTSGTSSVSSPPSFRPNLFHPYPSKDFRWVGFSGTVITIPPLSSDSFSLNVAVSSPGVYDLSRRLEHWCQNDLCSKPVLQVLKELCFLTVTNINN